MNSTIHQHYKADRDRLRAKLTAAGKSEKELIAFLKARQAVPAGIAGLQSVGPSKITIILANLDDILTNL